MNKQDPRKCKHYVDMLGYCELKHSWSLAHNLCPYECGKKCACPDFTPKDPRGCAHYGADGGCHKHSQKHGNIHVSMRCKAECGEPCEDYKTKTDKQ